MINLQRILIVTVSVLFVLVLIVGGFIIFNDAYFNFSYTINPELASNFGSFFGGFIGTLLTALSFLLLVYTLIVQKIENYKNATKDRFFRVIEFHNENVRNIRVPSLEIKKQNVIEQGRRAFVVYKIQIKRLMEIVTKINKENDLNLSEPQRIDIAYIIFYYGLDDRWESFIENKLRRYDNPKLITHEIKKYIDENNELKLGRTNQTELSSYFRNMYNGIKMVDNDPFLKHKDKLNLIKIYRAQLSNPELYVLFFNIISRFGKKWNENKYIERYELIKNLPKMYCDGVKPKNYYDIIYEDDD